jgi:ribonuclease T2
MRICRVASLSFALILASSWQAFAWAAGKDHYILSLSWSPSFCAAPEADDESLQCGGDRKFAFVVHGLWPQDGPRPLHYCPAQETWVPEELIEDMLPIMPSKSLVIHQWRKHGVCSGLSMNNYFRLTRTLFGKVKIPARYLSPLEPIVTTPEALIVDFLKTNKGLNRNMMQIECTSRASAQLAELRICFSPAGDFAQCRSSRRESCRAKTLMLPPVIAKS